MRITVFFHYFVLLLTNNSYIPIMGTEYREKLARYIIVLITIAIISAICWYLRSVLLYIILAAVVALLGSPICGLVCRISIKGHHIPRWAGSIVSIAAVFGIAFGIVTTVVPLVRDVIMDISVANVNNMTQAMAAPLAEFNEWMSDTFPQLGPGFRIESVILEQLQNLFNVSTFSAVVGSVTSFMAKLGITLFAVIFISFFLIKSPGTFARLITSVLPDKYDNQAIVSINESGTLVSRYMVGLAIEVFGVSLINFIGLLLVARMGFRYSIGIAFMTGLLNIIPYLGPLIGGAIGVVLSLIIKYICATSFGLAVGFAPFLLILIGIFAFTQLIDNYVYQPLIYSNSVKAHPLEIFIVLLIAGKIGGMAGMLAAIPAYTVIRVIARQFLGNVKFIRNLIGN